MVAKKFSTFLRIKYNSPMCSGTSTDPFNYDRKLKVLHPLLEISQSRNFALLTIMHCLEFLRSVIFLLGHTMNLFTLLMNQNNDSSPYNYDVDGSY